MGIFSFIKKIGSGLFNGIKKGAGIISDIGNRVRDGVKKAYNFTQALPVVGQLARQAVNTGIPFLGNQSLSQLGDRASNLIDAAGDVSQGNLRGAVNRLNPGMANMRRRMPDLNVD